MIVENENGVQLELPDGAQPSDVDAAFSHYQSMQPPSLSQNIQQGVAQTLLRSAMGQDVPMETALGLGSSIIQPLAGGAANAVASAIPQSVSNAAKSAWNGFKEWPQAVATLANSSNTGQALGDLLLQGKNAATDFMQNNPRLVRDVGNYATVAGVMPVIEGGAGLIGKVSDNITENGGVVKTLADVIKDDSSGIPFGKTLPPPIYNAAATHAAINKSYEGALQGANQAYDWMRKTATGKTIDASDMVAPVKDMIADIETDPFHEARTSLPKLRAFVDQATENPKIPLSDAVDMKQDINSNFNPKRFTQGAKTPYFQVGQMLDSKLTQAGTQYPLFGSAKQLADQTWVNTVAQPFTENSVLQKFWKPEDYYAQKSVEKGLAEQLPDATQKRAANMLGNVTDPVELNSVTRVLPSDMASTFKRAKLENITNGAGTSRLQSAGKALGSALNVAPLDTAKNLLHTIVGREYTPEEKALIEATRLPSPTLPIGPYQAKLGALKAGSPPEYPLAITYQPQAPSSEMLAGQSGIREATPQELSANEAVRQRAGQMGMYPASGVANPENIAPAQASALKGGSQLLQQYGSAPMLGNENMPPPIEKPSPKGAMGNAALLKLQRLDAAKKIADMEQGQNALGQLSQLSPEDIQSILNNREEVEKYQGASPFNTAMRDELLKAFKRNGK